MEGPAKEASAMRVISQPQMLDKLKDAESLLDDIQKGRSANLEEKSLPVLSKVHEYCLDLPVQWFNDELLETCLRQRMYSAPPPHLKPCFEGSAKLTFNHEKEITHMESAENEKVELVLRIIPASAKGLVEEWLHEILV